jgi:hypothetical protein
MNCYVCNLSGTVRPAVGVCRHCSAALCNEHFKEAQAFAVGGTTAYCARTPSSRQTFEKVSSLWRGQTNVTRSISLTNQKETVKEEEDRHV